MNDIPNPYDRVPYESFPYAQGHPEHLSVIAALFGIRVANRKLLPVINETSRRPLEQALSTPNRP